MGDCLYRVRKEIVRWLFPINRSTNLYSLSSERNRNNEECFDEIKPSIVFSWVYFTQQLLTLNLSNLTNFQNSSQIHPNPTWTLQTLTAANSLSYLTNYSLPSSKLSLYFHAKNNNLLRCLNGNVDNQSLEKRKGYWEEVGKYPPKCRMNEQRESLIIDFSNDHSAFTLREIRGKGLSSFWSLNDSVLWISFTSDTAPGLGEWNKVTYVFFISGNWLFGIEVVDPNCYSAELLKEIGVFEADWSRSPLYTDS